MDDTPLPEDPRDLYVRGPKITVARLAALYRGRFPDRKGLSNSNLKKRAGAENWLDLRRKYWEKVDQKVSARSAESHARTKARHVRQYRRVQQVGQRMIRSLESALDLNRRSVPDAPEGATAEEKELVRLKQSAVEVVGLGKEQLDALTKASMAVDISSKGERELVGERDDRVTRFLEGAGEIAEAQEGVVEYDAEAELLAFIDPTVVLDSRARPNQGGGQL